MELGFNKDLLPRRVRDPIRRNHSDIYRCGASKYIPTEQAVVLSHTRPREDASTQSEINVLKARKVQLPSILTHYDNVIEIPERFEPEQIQMADDMDFDIRLMQNYISSQKRQFEALQRRKADAVQ